MLIWIVFCFLWDDPLFNPEAESEKRYLDDPEFIELRREARLQALSILYFEIDMLRERAKRWKEQAAWHAWCHHHTLNQIGQHIPINNPAAWQELLEQMKVNAEVQRTLGFDFIGWFETYTNNRR